MTLPSLIFIAASYSSDEPRRLSTATYLGAYLTRPIFGLALRIDFFPLDIGPA